MATTAQHIAARDDDDLRDRLVAAAEMLGVPDAAAVVASRMAELVSVPISVGGQSTALVDVHAYAAAVRVEHLSMPQALPPGANPGAATDAHLAAAVAAVLAPADS